MQLLFNLIQFEHFNMPDCGAWDLRIESYRVYLYLS